MKSSESKLLVVGHRNPDTDAICSAIGQAELLRMTGSDAEAIRCGDVPSRTAWVLEKAGLETPRLVTDVRVTAGQIARREVISVSPEDSFLTVYRRMLASGVKSVPVVDSSGEVKGLLRYLDLLQLLLPAQMEGIAVRTVQASLQKICLTLQAEAVACASEKTEEEELHLLVGASSEETVQKRLTAAANDGIVAKYLVICGDRPGVQEAAIRHGVRALVVTGGFGVAPDLIAAAREKGVAVLLASLDTASVAKLIQCSRKVSTVVSGDFLVVEEGEIVSRLRKRLSVENQDLFPVVKRGTRTMVGVLSKSNLVEPMRTRLVLVDHNEFAQAVTGVDEAEIYEVIDHHRLAGDLASREPIRFLNEPVGSTSTLVARKFIHRDIEPSPGVALCLCAGLISDTLMLTSPTTTSLDREMLEWLAPIAKVDPETFTEEFFAVGSLLVGGTPNEILTTDRKEFFEEGVKISISQIEERGLSGFDKRKNKLVNALEALRELEGCDLALLVVTDISTHDSLILASGDPALLEALPYENRDGVFIAPGVVSRKKQVFPAVWGACRSAASKISATA
ncbi:putative manganese-dependent inorganic diphosphatase [Roseibacillus persicicus]|uniref:inorganic diphosphatase n=1 Tax=Roseibacillus persicicus TaxID=454148 RepID=A0A918WI60_9BACT|nr:putative manganese-dependent inorganic diphosphatase [Roseibacillus persicicus]MDQ8190386.1 putative manganese-dependent inorganic diphosphatase [Roseibacillus persicicus]GHC48533.1 manganese-dependent inorganic pyrophosphatase [Roseibacillus persicicus]